MIVSQLLKKNYTSPQLRMDLELILSFVLKTSRELVLAHPERKLSKDQLLKFNNLWKKRIEHCPLAYLTGQKEFYGLNFSVTQEVLIPRPETEYLVEKVITAFEIFKCKNATIIDIGTGSGCVAITLKKKLPLAKIIGLDISPETLVIAKKNAKQLQAKVDFYLGNSHLLTNKKIAPQIIVANLPYLDKTKKKSYYSKCPELRYEPAKALFADQNGLKDYIDLLKDIMLFEIKPILIFLEFGFYQLKTAKLLFKKICDSKYDITTDNYNGTVIMQLKLKV